MRSKFSPFRPYHRQDYVIFSVLWPGYPKFEKISKKIFRDCLLTSKDRARPTFRDTRDVSLGEISYI
jgi:hypothetical protein